jgi:hypothetical protein
MLDWGFSMKKDNEDTLVIIGAVILAITLFIAGPIFVLLALNTLFPVLAIPYTLGTWAATLIIIAVFRGKVKTK